MSNKKQQNKQIGNLGEQIACKYLVTKGFTILERNYWRKWGELDIVAKRERKLHFVEVKTVSYETRSELDQAISHETWRPEEQVHHHKLHQISKAIESWLAEQRGDYEWQIDVIAVRIVPRETFATVRFIENVIN